MTFLARKCGMIKSNAIFHLIMFRFNCVNSLLAHYLVAINILSFTLNPQKQKKNYALYVSSHNFFATKIYGQPFNQTETNSPDLLFRFSVGFLRLKFLLVKSLTFFRGGSSQRMICFLFQYKFCFHTSVEFHLNLILINFYRRQV